MTARSRTPSFWHDLPREGKLLLSLVVVDFVGRGLTLPFAVVYLHEVRDFSLGTTGTLIGLGSLVGFAAVGPGGALIDRIGARHVMQLVQVLLIVGSVLLAFASTVLAAALALVLQGLAFGVIWPASQSLIAAIVPAELRQRYFGVNFTLLNLGIGVGGIISGLLVDVDRLSTFQAIYLADAASFLPSAFLLAVPLRHVAGRPVHSDHDDGERPSYLTLLRNPAVRTLLVVSMVGAFVGYAQLNAGMTAFATVVGGVSTRALGFAFAANTAVIVLLQLFVLRWIEGYRRTRVLAMMGIIWAASWLCLGAAGLVPGTLGAALLVAACAAVFALGETLLQPTVPAMVNDLATDRSRGRANALNSAGFAFPQFIAPPIAGFLIDADLSWLYVASLVVGSLLIGVLAVSRLEPQLTPEVNGIGS
ncbi:Predicted arabinose efflux permease, MFS family [Nocardioides terrae]|uniref:Predicted arabinose efflux permease, MFS family n=1 Tax=Nocardioides terrae TaxID=574651 RepID=A0A1I1MVC8_9ACTN|nr:MFS transporter [Nocardioides terrae]SFC88842.1 Predicted arabinose efflux permease, MFS family [Nocardioides terrae]